MNTGKKKRSGGSSKAAKMGKRSVLTAEEEARRREEVKEKLRERMELERRALKVVERLLEDSISEDFLVDCAKFITQANYKDAVEERSIAKLCGYPICSNKLGKIPTQKYKISTKTNKVYDITERKFYCSNFCYKASKEFELQISPTALWLRPHESPPKIKLMKTGDGGSSGEEVMLSERRLQEEDVEDPLALPPASCDSSQLSSTASDLCHNDDSDSEQEQEQEQEFISSVVSQEQGRRVHWGELPKRTDEDGGANIESREVDEEETDDKDFSENQRVEEVTAKLGLCSLSQTVTPNTSLPDGSSAAQAQTSRQPSRTTSCEDLNPSTEIRPQLGIPHSTLKCSNQNNHNIQNQSDLNITQIGMSKRGAAGLRDLLKSQSPAVRPDSIRLKLLECLKTTLKAWSTDETLKFLYGADHALGAPFANVKEETKEMEGELDEDDLEEGVNLENEGAVRHGRPTVEAPDYEALQRETQQMELRIREFYNGTCFMPEDLEKPKQGGNKVTAQNQCKKEPVLPLIDSQAQHILQKRITVEKLTGCLKNIVGPLRLTMNDVTNDLNKLVRTFRFTNTNIIHTTPEWTLIAVVLLHLLVEVSPVVQEALQTPASVEYVDTLMAQLSLQQQDLLNMVQLFKTPAQSH
ncbi:putative RNA polymerase II subunit B1 CTD phosphatase rpap2 isoform X2 [Betta splendens]|uniref:RNA polymerase II subunit B1 CTD phosphatase RPAP2 homolog n=1 Tax=Betta splendens TaxID=158456 RepID=A0A6P7L020_BETSP|nr:putative RNA polymerase II subunit B1 CTD phosphatase rpap2 isoform X2 [Betta splendens]